MDSVRFFSSLDPYSNVWNLFYTDLLRKTNSCSLSLQLVKHCFVISARNREIHRISAMRWTRCVLNEKQNRTERSQATSIRFCRRSAWMFNVCRCFNYYLYKASCHSRRIHIHDAIRFCHVHMLYTLFMWTKTFSSSMKKCFVCVVFF